MLSAILFIPGYFVVVRVPGGGDVSESDFTSFYDSDSKMLQGSLLMLALVLAAAALVWLFAEIRSALGGGALAQVGATLGIAGAVTLAVGGAILMAPVGVQQNSDADFVGIPIAHTFAQAGLGVMLLVGMGFIALSTIISSVAVRKGALGPAWLSIVGIVLGVIILGSYIWLPGLVFPIWLLILAAVGLKSSVTRPTTDATA